MGKGEICVSPGQGKTLFLASTKLAFIFTINFAAHYRAN